MLFLVFGDQLFSEFSTRFFEIFAYLAHFRVDETAKNVKNLDHEARLFFNGHAGVGEIHSPNGVE